MRYSPFIFYSLTIAFTYLIVNPQFSYISIFFILLGYIIWNFAEYIFHRFIFHEKKLPSALSRFVSYDHVFHHRKPEKITILFLPVWLTASIYTVILLFWALILPLQYVWFIQVGLVVGYSLYEFMHYSAHHMAWRNPVLRFMRKYHEVHHFSNPRTHYMVSNPLLDIMFNTFKSHK